MTDQDRRFARVAPPVSALESQLNDDQLITLRELEHYGWELKFVRKLPGNKHVPVLFDGDRKKFAVLELDGTLNENPGFDIRH